MVSVLVKNLDSTTTLVAVRVTGKVLVLVTKRVSVFTSVLVTVLRTVVGMA